MIFNMMGSLVKKDAEWIPLNTGAQTRAPDPGNWTSYSFILDRQPSIVVLKTHYGGADNYAVIDWFGGFGFGIVDDIGFRNASITSAKTINDLPSGSKVQLGSYRMNSDVDGFDLIWNVARDSAQNNALRLVLSPESTQLFDGMQFDAKEINDPNTATNYKVWGRADYVLSGIRQWLNADSNNDWWTSQHTYDEPPSYADTAYGFFNYAFSPYEASYLEPMSFTILINDNGVVTEKSFSDKVVLMSDAEAGVVSYGETDVGTLDIFPNDSSRIVPDSMWWTRSQHKNYPTATITSGTTITGVNKDGTGRNASPSQEDFKPRPMIAPKLTTPVSATPNEMGYYTVEISYPATVTLEINGGGCFYCPIYDSE